MAELADMLTEVDRPPSWWRGLYAALADVDPAALAELGALPVPLADGRLIRGPRGVLLPGPGLGDPARLAPLRLRIVDRRRGAPAAGPARRAGGDAAQRPGSPGDTGRRRRVAARGRPGADRRGGPAARGRGRGAAG